jgi:hypothetical protein
MYICKCGRKVLLKQGVPQGGVLPLTLFILYMNDIIPELPKGVHTAIYADDKFSHDVHFYPRLSCFHVILLSKVTPRYVCCSSILSGVSSKVSLPSWILGESVKRVPILKSVYQ